MLKGLQYFKMLNPTSIDYPFDQLDDHDDHRGCDLLKFHSIFLVILEVYKLVELQRNFTVRDRVCLRKLARNLKLTTSIHILNSQISQLTIIFNWYV